MKTKKIFLFFLFFISVTLLTGQGCISTKKQQTSSSTIAGIWLSEDKAENWTQRDLMPTINGVQRLSNLDVSFLIFNRRAPDNVYWGAGDAGLYVSYDGMRSWQEIKKIPKTRINDLEIDPQAQNIVYLSIGNRIYKSNDCCHNWRDIYSDIPGIAINALAIDYTNSSRILAGLADGRLLVSLDAGTNWSMIYNFKTSIKDIFFNPRSPAIIYAVMNGQGLYKSLDGGINWTQNESLKKIPGGNNINYAFFDETKEDGLYILTDAGFFRSENNNWKNYKLLTPEGKVKITAFAANPYNPNEIYYTTENTLYKSTNSGTTWTTKNLPTGSKPVYLMIHPENQNTLIMGTQRVEKK